MAIINPTDAPVVELSVDTIAALRLLPGGIFKHVLVDGYYTPSDGGGGLFRWNGTDATADNLGTVIAPSAGTGRWKRVLDQTSRISTKFFGSLGIGAAGAVQDTAAFTAAYTYAQAQAFAGIASSNVPLTVTQIDVPTGDHVFNGPSLNSAGSAAVCFIGAGRQQTRIQIAAGIYFVDTDKLIYSADVRGINFSGGKGAFRYSGATVNVQGTHVYEDCFFGDYTECAIGHDRTDFPYWKVRRNHFFGTISSIGIALNGLADQSTIEDNEFIYNLIHCKVGSDGTMVMIRNNDFIRNFAYAGTARTDIWLVPGQQTVGQVGTQIINNRMGNENLDANDYRILIADEDAATGTDHLNFRPKLAASANFVSAVKIKDNRVGGVAGARELITSWTKQLCGVEARNDFFGTLIPTLRFGAGVWTPGGTQDAIMNTFEASSQAAPTGVLLPEPVVPYVGVLEDPNAMHQGYASVFSPRGGGHDPSFLDLTTTLLSGFIVGTGATALVTDALGGQNAIEFTATGAGFQAFGTHTPMTANRVGFVEFDLKQGAATPLPAVDFRISNNVNLGDIVVRRIIPVTAFWKRIRIPYSLPSNTGTYNLASFQASGFQAGVATRFMVGRLRVYHAHEPIHPGTVYLEEKAAFNPPNLVDGAGTTTTITVAGAALGDYAIASFSLDLQGITVTAYVSAPNTVSIRFQNESGGALDLAAGTLTARVFKFLAN